MSESGESSILGAVPGGQWLEPRLEAGCLDLRAIDPRRLGRRNHHRELAWLPRYLVTFEVESGREELGWEIWICGLDGSLCGGRPEPRARAGRSALETPPDGSKLLEVHSRLSPEEAVTQARSSLARTAQVLRVVSDVHDATVEFWRVPAWVEIFSGPLRGGFRFRGRDAVTGESLGAVARQALLQRLVELEPG